MARVPTQSNRTRNGADGALDGWRLDADRNRLVRGDREIRLEPRVMQTLAALLARAGEPVRREELIRAVWGHAHVTDDALNRCVAQLRRAFRRMDKAPVIETLPRVGYQLHPVESPDRRRPGAAVLAVGALAAAAVVAAAVVVLWPEAGPRWDRVSAPAPVTSRTGAEFDAAWAPDATAIAYVHRATGSPARLYLRRPGAEASVPLTDGTRQAAAPAWSPDGRRIAYLSFAPGECRVALVGPEGGTPRNLTTCDPRSDHSLAWLGGGISLAYTPPADGVRPLGRFDLDSGRTTPLTRPGADDIGDAEPALSPDERHLAFTRWHDYGVGDLYVLDLASGEEHRLTDDGVKVHGSSWDGDRRIVFASNRGGSFGLWSVGLGGGEPQPLVAGYREVDGPAVAPDGGALLFEQWSGRSEILRLDPATGATTAVISSSRWDWSPRLSPDGTRIAFVSDRSGTPEVWTAVRDGSSLLRLTDHGNAYVNDVAWAADGSAVYYAAPVDGQFDLYRVSAAGGVSRRVTDDPASERFPHAAADGSLYFGSRRGGRWHVHRLRPGASEAETVVPGSVARTDAAAGALYVADCRSGALTRYRLPDTGEAESLMELSPIDCASWTLAGDALYAVIRDDRHQPSLARIDLQGGATRTLQETGTLKFGTLIDADDDGIWYTSVLARESDLVMIGRAAGRER